MPARPVAARLAARHAAQLTLARAAGLFGRGGRGWGLGSAGLVTAAAAAAGSDRCGARNVSWIRTPGCAHPLAPAKNPATPSHQLTAHATLNPHLAVRLIPKYL